MNQFTSNALRRFLGPVMFLLLAATGLRAQSGSISGTVKSSKGDPMPGVTVVLKNAGTPDRTKGTTTDQNGTYRIDAGPGSTLVFSFIGYQPQEIKVGDQRTLNVALTESTASLDEVVVTAENRSVSAQRVPITMDLVTAKAIVRNNVTDLLQLQAIAPGLNIVQNTIFNQINVRGIGSNDGAAELSDQAVTVGIDGEYINRPVALNTAMFDLDRVEVLKGPQGTLYGRNATAGAVNIVAKKPTLKREADLSATYGNYSTLKLQGAVNLPLGKLVAVRAAGILSRHDGYRDGGALVGRIDNGNFWASRLGVSINPNGRLSAYVAGELSKTDQQAPSQYGVSLSNIAELNGRPPRTWTVDLPNDYPVATAGFVKADQAAIRGRAAYEFGKAILTYSAGYRHVDMTGYQPLNGFVPETFSFDNLLRYDTQNHELRLNGESEKLIWQVGGFYGREDQHTGRGLVLPSAKGAFGGQVPYLSYFLRDIVSTTSAVFGQATYNFSEKVGLTVGLRNTTDKKDRISGELASVPFAPNSVKFFYPNAPTAVGQAGVKASTGIPSEGKWNQTTWLVGLDYRIDPNKLLFAKVSTGYKAGGFDNIGLFKPERLTAYEIGTKNKFMYNRLRLNASAFHYDYIDQQVSVFISTAVGSAIQNAGGTTVNGVEVEGEYAASKADRFRLTVNYLDARFKDLPTVENIVGGDPVAVNLQGNRPIQAPKWTLMGSYSRDFSVGSGMLTATLQTLYKSDYYLTPFNYAMDQQAAYTKTDIYLTYTGRSGKWDVGLFGQNLEDNRIKVYSSFNGSTINIYNWIFGTPRTFGVQANLHF